MHLILPAPVRRSLLPALATLVLTSGLAAQNLILNGSFEAPSISNVTTSSPTSWTLSGSYAYLVNGTNGFVLNQGAPYFEHASAGIQLITLYSDAVSVAQATQSVALEAGTQYTLSFDFMKPVNLGVLGTGLTVSLSDGVQTIAPTSLNSTYDASAIFNYHNDTWVTAVVTFTAQDTGNYALTFGNFTNSSSYFAAVDNVSLTGSAVPEPANCAAILGMVTLGAARVRRYWRRRERASAWRPSRTSGSGACFTTSVAGKSWRQGA